MLEKFKRGWSIALASWAILKRFPKLFILPAISGAAMVALLALLVSTVFIGNKTGGVEHLQDRFGTLASLMAFYFVCSLVFIFFNSALVFCSLQVFKGDAPSIRAGLKQAARRLPQILAWTLFATTIGMALNLLQSFLKDKLGFLGSLLGGIFEIAWVGVTYLTIPLLVVEGRGPISTLKRSASIMRQTWGESASGTGALGAITFLLLLPAFMIVGIAAASGVDLQSTRSIQLVLASGIGLYLVASIVMMAAIETVFQAGIYEFATTGKAPSSMDPALLKDAFRS